MVAIDPKDFVSFPRDYNNSKARVCEYEVLCAIDKENLANLNASLAADWRFNIDYQSPITYPFLAAHLGKLDRKFKKLRKAVIANMTDLDTVTDVAVKADLNLWKVHNS